MGIKAVLLDIDDTLFASSEFSELARMQAVHAMKRMGLKQDTKKIFALLQKIVEKHGSNYPGHLNVLVHELKVEKRLKARIIAAGVAAYHNAKHSIQPFPEVPETLVRLRDAGYELYVASEGRTLKQWDKLIRLGLAHFFDDVFVSEDLECMKSKKFYSRIARKLKLKPSELVMVGDRKDKDIVPAREAGMHTVRIVAGAFAKTTGPEADYKIRKMSELTRVLSKLV
ncbi:TIGR02253 family HAD-type hydrolase [Candidatus Micrarchaeota archaeon]|nr:TIGR02253 family HAD-type hydrolase [Candidatus Micrarchaeota archaeon]